MTATDTRIPLATAEVLAAELLTLLAPTCLRIVVAGSIRRRSLDVGDIEYLAIPMVQRIPIDLFGTKHDERDLLAETCEQLVEHGVVSKRLNAAGNPAAWGDKHKRMLYRDVPVDLFTADYANWGYQLVLRTGPWQFSKRLVTQQYQGGWMPFGMRGHEGRLWRGNTALDTPDEESVFAAIGWAYLKPEERRP